MWRDRWEWQGGKRLVAVGLGTGIPDDHWILSCNCGKQLTEVHGLHIINTMMPWHPGAAVEAGFPLVDATDPVSLVDATRAIRNTSLPLASYLLDA